MELDSEKTDDAKDVHTSEHTTSPVAGFPDWIVCLECAWEQGRPMCSACRNGEHAGHTTQFPESEYPGAWEPTTRFDRSECKTILCKCEECLTGKAM